MPFYARAGFAPEGEEFEEVGIRTGPCVG